MKKSPLFLLLALIAISSFIGATFITDDDESPRDQFCNLAVDTVLPPLDGFASPITLVLAENSWKPLPLISYIAQHEKSPPLFSLIGA